MGFSSDVWIRNAFVTGGYNTTVSTCCGNPIGGRRAWSGSSGGYVTSSINLPSSAFGQNVQLKWRMATDNIVAAPGVWIDNISVARSVYVCSTSCLGRGFADDPLFRGLTAVQALHVSELRARIDAQRVRFGLSPYQWTGTTLVGAVIQAAHINQMRIALDEAYVAHGLPPPTYVTDPGTIPANGTVMVRADHIMELRAAVFTLEGS